MSLIDVKTLPRSHVDRVHKSKTTVSTDLNNCYAYIRFVTSKLFYQNLKINNAYHSHIEVHAVNLWKVFVVHIHLYQFLRCSLFDRVC